MKKKLLATILLIALLFNNYIVMAAGVAYTRSGGENLYGFASIIEDSTIDAKYSAKSNKVAVNEADVNLPGSTLELIKEEYLTNKIQLDYGDKVDVGSIIYRNAITYNNENYDVKLSILKISSDIGSGQVKTPSVDFIVGKLNDGLDPTKLTQDDIKYENFRKPIPIDIHAVGMDAGSDGVSNKVEVTTKYEILKNNQPVAISGIFGMKDIDLRQGMFVEDFTANSNNTYLEKKIENNDKKQYLKYKTQNNGTYFYIEDYANDVDGLAGDSEINAYVLLDNKSSITTTSTFDYHGADIFLNFYTLESIIGKYNITTEVVGNVGGTIDDSITNINSGEEKTIKFSPNKGYRLKSITVDGNNVTIDDTNKSQYVFKNITANHTIKVEFEKIYEVTYDAKGGTPTPETEYVAPDGKATKPTTDPTRDGYTFNGWMKENETKLFDFDNTKINENIKLVADWTPIKYNIEYVLNANDAINDSSNPSEYTKEDEINFKPPTRNGYTFLGWYEDEELTKPKNGISHETGNKKVYAKWEAEQAANAKYKVEHYKENDNGEYDLVVTDDLEAKANEEVTATPKEYPGFKENTKLGIASGTVKEDGSLVLKLYYDKIEYTVSFEPKNDTTIDDQIVDYGDKAIKPKEPTKNGYVFRYWYYLDENGNEVAYNFDSPVTSNVHLIAKWEEEVVPKEDPQIVIPKTDGTTAQKIIPKTGEMSTPTKIIIVGIGIILAIFGIKLFKLRDISK